MTRQRGRQSMAVQLTLAILVVIAVTACGTSGTQSVVPSEPSGASSSPAEPTPSATGTPSCPGDLPYAAGTYLWSAKMTETIPLTVTMTDGWKGCGLSYKELGEPGGVMLFGFWEVRNVYANPCSWKTSLPDQPTGPTVDALMQAMSDQSLTEAKPPEDVAVDGYAGSYVRLEVPADLDTSHCDTGDIAEFRFFNGDGDSVWWLGAADAPGLIGEVWAFDVKGTRVVAVGASFSDAPDANRAEMKQIVESVHFLP